MNSVAISWVLADAHNTLNRAAAYQKRLTYIRVRNDVRDLAHLISAPLSAHDAMTVDRLVARINYKLDDMDIDEQG